MSAWSSLTPMVDALQPHVVATALIGARLVPVAFLCPLLGGSHAPTHVKLGLVLALSLFLHVAGGIGLPPGAVNAFDFVGIAFKEVLLGTTLGLIASLPFDAARMGGRFIDLFRGSSAEAALPMAGTKEAATGDALYHLLLALASTGVVMPLTLAALFKSYTLAPLGTFVHSEDVAMQVAALVGGAFATGLAIGAPIAGASLAVDACLGLASRAAPGMNLQDTGAPLRILGGGAVIWLAVGLFAARLQEYAAGTPDAMRLLLDLGV
ncbi:MAG: flagellar biosynthetic protein FliR [Myxococcota bacterium]